MRHEDATHGDCRRLVNGKMRMGHAMNDTHTGIVLLLLVILVGCKNDASVNPLDSKTLTREQLIEVARESLLKSGYYEEGDNVTAYFDIHNEKWRALLGQMGKDDPAEAKEYHAMLDKRSYQALHFAHDSPRLGGTYWVLVDVHTGHIIMLAGGL